jgi:hypothetical protein
MSIIDGALKRLSGVVYSGRGQWREVDEPPTSSRATSMRRAASAPTRSRWRTASRSRLTSRNVRWLRLDLEPWRDTQAVRELDEQLAVVGASVRT